MLGWMISKVLGGGFGLEKTENMSGKRCRCGRKKGRHEKKKKKGGTPAHILCTGGGAAPSSVSESDP